jgi:hypothetical protein
VDLDAGRIGGRATCRESAKKNAMSRVRGVMMAVGGVTVRGRVVR